MRELCCKSIFYVTIAKLCCKIPAAKSNLFHFVAALLQHYFAAKIEFVVVLNWWATCSIFHSHSAQHFFTVCGWKMLLVAPSPWHTRIPGRKSWMLDSGRWTLNTGLWTLDSGLSMLESGPWSLDARLWTLDFGLWTLGSGLWMLDSGHWMLGSGRWTLDAGL